MKKVHFGAMVLVCLWAAHMAYPTRAEEPKAQNVLDTASDYLVYLPLVSRDHPPELVDEFGLNFISSPDSPSDSFRYGEATDTGASRNRWPLYWYSVEKQSGVYDWARADAVVAEDIAHGFKPSVILMGTPSFYSTAGSALAAPETNLSIGASKYMQLLEKSGTIDSVTSAPQMLDAPVFSDGTDIPGTGKTINPANPWARFVFATVERFTPIGVTEWEIWNEPDLDFFWSGSPIEYARLLKVAYLAAKHASPHAKVIFGGLANFEKPHFLSQVLDSLSSDPMSTQYGYFFDILATHSYSYAWDSWRQVWRAKRTLENRGLNKPIWLNESGTPAWDDYPGPTWDELSPYRSTMNEGASYIIQSAMYAKYAGAEVVYHFQLFDDCGNDPYGTDFPPSTPPYAGDAFGLVRNLPDYGCYRQHPDPGTRRPAFTAFQQVTKHLAKVEPLWRKRPGGTNPYDGPQEWIAFYRPSTNERVLGLWSRDGNTHTAQVPATADSAKLIDQRGNIQIITPVDGMYSLDLPPATNQNLPYAPDLYAIGGEPYLLIERDSYPPSSSIELLEIVPPEFELRWSGEDWGSGIGSFDVWMSVDGGPLELILDDTTGTSMRINGSVGQDYRFVITATDLAGNSMDIASAPQAQTTVGLFTYLPIVTSHSK